ncbi:Hypothetical protein A7982_00420 [Minicystis rosea]|nr:Hypothetical protein A7982_00420 [Minicystis rosea]
MILLLATAGACAAGTATTGTFGTGGGGNTANGGGGATSSSQSSTGSDVGGGTFTTSGTGTGGAPPVDFAAYAHTGKALYSIDPMAPSAAPKLIGNFDCIGGTGQDSAMTDLAVNQSGDIWGISDTKIYRLTVEGSVVHCATTITLPNPNAVFYGLTFAPAGILDDSTKEVLVAGNTAGQLWSVDTTNGTLTQHGTFGNVPANDGHGHSYDNKGKAWELSGDIVFLANGGNPVGFAAVRDCPNPPSTSGCNATDTLIAIDMTKLKSVGSQSVTLKVRGQMLKSAGCSGADTAYERMLGIAAWNDKVYGFSHNSAIVEIDNNDGSACLVASTPNVFWNGAGVTTLAPVIKPPE